MLSRIVNLLRTRHGMLFVAIGCLLVIIGLAPSCRSTKRAALSPPSAFPDVSSNSHFAVSRTTVPVTAYPPKPEPTVRTNQWAEFYVVHVNLPSTTNAAAPFGRLLQCQLVNTLESLAPQTPIIGLVTEALWFDGKLIIPTGSEVHVQAQLDRVRERVTSTGPCTIVLQTGEQLVVSGVVLDREFAPDGSGWGLTDGSAGIRGEILRSASLEEVKLFLATAISGLATGLQQTRETPFGTRVRGTLHNAGLAGTSQVMNTYAQRILEAIQREGLYVQVPAGKQFYVYVTDIIDRSKARLLTSNLSTNR
jgi:hypothetical protein